MPKYIFRQLFYTFCLLEMFIVCRKDILKNILRKITWMWKDIKFTLLLHPKQYYSNTSACLMLCKTTIIVDDLVPSKSQAISTHHAGSDMTIMTSKGILWCVVTQPLRNTMRQIQKGSLDSKPALVVIMARDRIGEKPLFETMMAFFNDEYICIYITIYIYMRRYPWLHFNHGLSKPPFALGMNEMVFHMCVCGYNYLSMLQIQCWLIWYFIIKEAWQFNCLFNSFFSLTTNKTPKFHITDSVSWVRPLWATALILGNRAHVLGLVIVL